MVILANAKNLKIPASYEFAEAESEDNDNQLILKALRLLDGMDKLRDVEQVASSSTYLRSACSATFDIHMHAHMHARMHAHLQEVRLEITIRSPYILAHKYVKCFVAFP